MSMGMGYDESYAARQAPEARAELEAIQAGVREKRHEMLLEELGRYRDHLLPGSVEAIAAQHRRSLGASSDPARVAVAVSEFMRGPLSGRYKKPAAEADTLRTVLGRYRDAFKSDQALEQFHAAHALDLAHRPESDVVAFVARAVVDRKHRALLKHESPITAGTRRLVEALKPFDAMLRGDLVELAEGDVFGDLAGANSPTDVKHLSQLVESRLKNPKSRAAALLVDGEFDPSKVLRPRPAQQQAESGPAPAREPLFRF